MTTSPEARAQFGSWGNAPQTPRKPARFARHTGRRLHLQANWLETLMLACKHTGVHDDCTVQARQCVAIRPLFGPCLRSASGVQALCKRQCLRLCKHSASAGARGSPCLHSASSERVAGRYGAASMVPPTARRMEPKRRSTSTSSGESAKMRATTSASVVRLT